TLDQQGLGAAGVVRLVLVRLEHQRPARRDLAEPVRHGGRGHGIGSSRLGRPPGAARASCYPTAPGGDNHNPVPATWPTAPPPTRPTGPPAPAPVATTTVTTMTAP